MTRQYILLYYTRDLALAALHLLNLTWSPFTPFLRRPNLAQRLQKVLNVVVEYTEVVLNLLRLLPCFAGGCVRLRHLHSLHDDKHHEYDKHSEWKEKRLVEEPHRVEIVRHHHLCVMCLMGVRQLHGHHRAPYRIQIPRNLGYFVVNLKRNGQRNVWGAFWKDHLHVVIPHVILWIYYRRLKVKLHVSAPLRVNFTRVP